MNAVTLVAVAACALGCGRWQFDAIPERDGAAIDGDGMDVDGAPDAVACAFASAG